MVEKFKEFLVQSNMAKNTVSAYVYAVNDFNSRHSQLTKKELLLYKAYLIETFKPKTVNLRIQALNKFADSCTSSGKKTHYKIPFHIVLLL